MEAIGGCIVNADITVLADEPKLGARRDEIRHLIAKEFCVSPRRVNVKATTMEGLGAIGRKEGIAAMATVTVAVQ
jgi:2-C-methyl-D-erythritol 4-phosphate cytidylyltransferase/2-C-methyl-D-erythritol 2,4-cyclodiphosphate synthase